MVEEAIRGISAGTLRRAVVVLVTIDGWMGIVHWLGSECAEIAGILLVVSLAFRYSRLKRRLDERSLNWDTLFTRALRFTIAAVALSWTVNGLLHTRIGSALYFMGRSEVNRVSAEFIGQAVVTYASRDVYYVADKPTIGWVCNHCSLARLQSAYRNGKFDGRAVIETAPRTLHRGLALPMPYLIAC